MRSQAKPFPVTLNDVCKEPLQKRIDEKIAAGYTLIKDITPVVKTRNDYLWTNKRGPKYRFNGNCNETHYRAVVEKL
jgi:hypothetical protein